MRDKYNRLQEDGYVNSGIRVLVAQEDIPREVRDKYNRLEEDGYVNSGILVWLTSCTKGYSKGSER